MALNKYRKATAELIEKLLREADQLNVDLDKLLHEVSEEILEEVVKELQKLEKDGKIDLAKGINLNNNPAIYRVLKTIEYENNKKWDEFTWISYMAMTDYFASVYKTTVSSTLDIFRDLNINPSTKFNTSQKPTPQIITPKVIITDTYNVKDKIEIPWCKDGKTYSQRLYSNVANFESKLNFVLEEGLVKGKGIEWMERAWRKLTGSAAYETARLIKTEASAFWSQATRETYLSMGIEYVEIVNDTACGAICLDFVDGTPIPLAEAEVGGLLPPYHANCMCSYIAYTDAAETDEYIEE